MSVIIVPSYYAIILILCRLSVSSNKVLMSVFYFLVTALYSGR